MNVLYLIVQVVLVHVIKKIINVPINVGIVIVKYLVIKIIQLYGIKVIE
jgi:Na+(H+)/acetate symporter ActP